MKSILLILAIFLLATAALLLTRKRLNVPDNAIVMIRPYWHEGTWVFDDARVNLVREPFVAGVPEMIDHLTREIPGARNGFRLLFSAEAFPGHQAKLTWVRSESGGGWYYYADLGIEGWLCPALFKYYKNAPREIYVKAEAIKPLGGSL